MHRTRLAIVVGVLAITPSAAFAGPPGKWDPITRGGDQSSTSQVGVARNRHGALQVVWQRQTGPLSHDLLHTALTPGGRLGRTSTIVSGWNGIVDAALAVRSDANDELLAFFSGQRTAESGEPHFGLNLATSATGASWSLAPASIYTGDAAYARTPSVALVNGVPLQTWYAVAEPVVHVGLDPGTPARALPVSGEALNENIASEGSSAVVAWCQGLSGGKGFFAQRVDAVGAPLGGAVRMPGSATAFGGSEHLICPPTSFRTPLAARAGGGVYVAGLTGYPQRNAIRLWRVGSPRAEVVARGSRLGDGIALAPDASGRIWLAWSDGTTVRARRSNRSATVLGKAVAVPAPRGQAALYNVDASALSDRLDVLGRYGTVSNTITLFHTQVHPGLSLSASGRKPLRFRVTDAGDPVAGATVAVGGKRVTTNANGLASVTLPPGSYRAVASKARYASDTARVRVPGR